MQRRVEAVFSGRDAGLSTTMNSIRQGANDMAREMLDQANATSNSARQSIEDYEDQVKAMERRNRVSSQSTRIEIENRRKIRQSQLDTLEVVSPKEQDKREAKIKDEASNKIIDVSKESITDDEKKEKIKVIEVQRDKDIEEMKQSSIGAIPKQQRQKEIDSDFKNEIADQKQLEQETKIQVEVLKEILQAIKTTSRKEISSEEYMDGRESNREDVRYLSEVGEQATDLSQRLSDEGGNMNPVDAGGGNKANTAINTARNALTSRDGIGAAQSVAEGGASMLGIASNPYVLAAMATMVVGKVGMESRGDRVNSARELSALGGYKAEKIIDSGLGESNIGEERRPIDYGITREEFLSVNMPRAARSAGTVKGSKQRAINQIEVDKSVGLNEGTAASLDKLSRVTGGDAKQITQDIITVLRETGQLGEKGNDMTKLNEYVQGFISMTEQNLARFGTSESQGTMGVMKELGGLGGNFDREDYTVEATRNLDEGLRGGSNEAKAMKMSVLRQLNPEMERFELETEYEKGINSEGFLEGVMEFIRSSGGNRDQQAQMLHSMTGGAMRREDTMAMVDAGLDFKGVNKEQEKSKTPVDFASRAAGTISDTDTNIKFMAEGMKDVASKIGKLTEVVSDKLEESNKAIKESNNLKKSQDR